MKTVNYKIVLTLFILALLMLNGCMKKKNSKLTIVTTIYPYELIIKQIVQDKADVFTIIPANASPHNYSPLPSDVEKISQADLIFSNGLELETGLEKILTDTKEKHIMLSGFIPKDVIIKDESEDEHHLAENEAEHHHNHAEGNPHIWLNPEMIIDIAKGITQSIISIDPANQMSYNANLAQLISEVEKADANIIAQRKNLNDLNLISFHSSFAYFDARYNIHSLGYIQKSPGKEPNPKELMLLSKTIKNDKISVIIIEPQLNPKPAEIIAKEFNLKLIKLDPLGTTLKINKIDQLLLKNWELLLKGVH